MERLVYILDTNAVSDYINQFDPTTRRIKQAIREGHLLYLCQPVYYEVLRGLIKTNAAQKRRVFEEEFVSLLIDLPLTNDDWRQAAQFWVDAVSTGKQLADTDLLIAAIVKRVNGIVVSADADFDALPIKRENWRVP
ncbi:MAG: PIN domain-containing protein [Chloroflexi bacterium]|nr:PIN domain-containing protein [Chloroflexota bacterium]